MRCLRRAVKAQEDCSRLHHLLGLLVLGLHRSCRPRQVEEVQDEAEEAEESVPHLSLVLWEEVLPQRCSARRRSEQVCHLEELHLHHRRQWPAQRFRPLLPLHLAALTLATVASAEVTYS